MIENVMVYTPRTGSRITDPVLSCPGKTMKQKYLLYSASVVASLMPCAGAMASANWTASFVAPSDATASLRIDLPADLDLVTLTTLGVELDGTDITAMLQMDGDDFVYTPAQQLSEGSHIVRLVVLGDGTDKGQWTFAIGDAPQAAEVPEETQMAQMENWLRGGSVNLDTLTEASNRIADHNLDNDAPNHGIISGAGDLNANAEGVNWDVSTRANYLVQTDKTLSLTGNTMDLGEYEMTANMNGDVVKGGMTLGHHDIGVESKIFSGFYRRGASARLGTTDDRVMAQGFAFRPESMTGGRNFTGLNDNQDRLEGMTATVKPFSNDMDALAVTGIYYDGRGDDGGTGFAGENITSTGSGWGTIIEKSFGQQRMKLRGEYALGVYDEDGSGISATEDAGEALAFSAEFRPFKDLVLRGTSADFVVGASYERIDTYFESLANEGLASDRDAISAYANLYWGAFAANFQLLHEKNNVDDLHSMATDRLRNAALNMSYTFDPQQGAYSWLGTPYLNFSAFVADMDRVDTPVGYDGFDTNNMSDSITLGGGASYDAWYWSASQSFSQYEDFAGASNDTINNFTSLAAGWQVNDRLTLDSGVSFGHFADQDANTQNFDTNINLSMNAIVIPEKVNFNMDYNLNLSTGSGDTPDRHIVNSEVEYTIRQPARNRLGMAVAVRGSMENTHGSADALQNETEYQVFTVLRIKAPFGYDF